MMKFENKHCENGQNHLSAYLRNIWQTNVQVTWLCLTKLWYKIWYVFDGGHISNCVQLNQSSLQIIQKSLKIPNSLLKWAFFYVWYLKKSHKVYVGHLITRYLYLYTFHWIHYSLTVCLFKWSLFELSCFEHLFVLYR